MDSRELAKKMVRVLRPVFEETVRDYLVEKRGVFGPDLARAVSEAIENPPEHVVRSVYWPVLEDEVFAQFTDDEKAMMVAASFVTKLGESSVLPPNVLNIGPILNATLEHPHMILERIARDEPVCAPG